MAPMIAYICYELQYISWIAGHTQGGHGTPYGDYIIGATHVPVKIHVALVCQTY